MSNHTLRSNQIEVEVRKFRLEWDLNLWPMDRLVLQRSTNWVFELRLIANVWRILNFSLLVQKLLFLGSFFICTLSRISYEVKRVIFTVFQKQDTRRKGSVHFDHFKRRRHHRESFLKLQRHSQLRKLFWPRQGYVQQCLRHLFYPIDSHRWNLLSLLPLEGSLQQCFNNGVIFSTFTKILCRRFLHQKQSPIFHTHAFRSKVGDLESRAGSRLFSY